MVRQESWWACVIWPSRLEQSRISTEFDPTLKSPGSRGISGLCPLESGEPWVPPSLPMWEHWITASTNCRLPLQIAVHPGSYPLTPLVAPRLVAGLRVSSWLWRVRSPHPKFCSPAWSGHRLAVDSVGPSSPWCPSAAWGFHWGGCTPSVPDPLARCITPPSVAHPAPVRTSPVFPRNLWCQCWCSGVLLSTVEGPLIPAPLNHADFIRTSQQTRCIYQCLMYTSISEGVGVGGSTTLKRTSKGFAVVAAAGACSIVESTPTQLCPSRSQASSGSQSVNHLTCGAICFVQWCRTFDCQHSNLLRTQQLLSNTDSRGSECRAAPNILLPRVPPQNLLQVSLRCCRRCTKVRVPKSNKEFQQDQTNSF